MDIRAIDHIEFYVEDAEQAAAYLCDAFGFTEHGRGGPETGQDDCRLVLLRQRDITILLTSALDDQHQAREYVRRHGNGVAVIGFTVDDAEAAFAEAVERGALPVAPPVVLEHEGGRVTYASVNGFGDVEHRFASRASAGAPFAPGIIKETGSTATGREPLHVVDHLAVCLPAGELDETVRRYQEVFGFTRTSDEQIIVGSQAMDSTVIKNPAGTVTFSIIEPDTTRAPGQIDEFIRSHGGAGVQHIAFLTDDMTTSEAPGVRFLTTPPSYYDALTARLGPVGRWTRSGSTMSSPAVTAGE
jgi:4-hydroxymandelate synthase